jgi:hypothetical protein
VRSLLLAGCLFAWAYTQSPYGFSNQNQYLLHGAAISGYGNVFREDWLANTKDPTPLFSGYIAIVDGMFRHQLIWLSYFAVLVLYVVSLAKLLEKLPGTPTTAEGRRIAFGLLLLSHAAIWRLLSVKLFGVDYPWYFQTGFASQYILGAGFQPSVFGVFLLSSLAAFLHERRHVAVACAVAACVVHFTYFLPSILLGCGYVFAIVRNGGGQPAVRFAAMFGVALLPVVAFNAIRFQPTDAATFAEAQRLLAEVRIPHHALVSRWLDPIAGLQIAWILLGIGFVRRSTLGAVLLVAIALAATLTLVAALTNHHLLCLLFPWRISAVLVPVATAILACRFSRWVERRVERRWAKGGSILATIIIGVSLAAGLLHPFSTFGYATNDERERNLYASVNRLSHSGDVYLIPTRIPKLNSGSRGAASTTFTPPPRPTPGSNLIPVDLQRFRLLSGRPIFVDFKSIPYADVEVVEWYRRVSLASRWYENGEWHTLAVQEAIRQEGITHIVVAAATPLDSAVWELLYQDEYFRVYRFH